MRRIPADPGDPDAHTPVVSGVEVSVDGGATWHPTTGAGALWTYTWTPAFVGPTDVMTRAVDDSGNLETAGGAFTITVGARLDHALLFYNGSAAANGAHAIAKLADDGTFTHVSSGQGFSVGWTHLVQGGDDFVLFYNSSAPNPGHLVTGRLSSSGVYTHLKQNVDMGLEVCPGWTNIAVTNDNIVLFYRRTGRCAANGGNLAVGKLLADGTMQELSVAEFSEGWTHVTVTANNVVTFYNSTTGMARTALLDKNGGLRDLVTSFSLSPGWSHVVAGVNNLLLLYNMTTGDRMIGRLSDSGVFTNLGSGPGFSTGWTHIVGSARNTVLLFYNKNSPVAATAIGRLDASGVYTDVRQYNGLLSTGWTHIVAE